MSHRPSKIPMTAVFFAAVLFFTVQLQGAVAAPSTTIDPVKQAAWEEAQAQAAKRVADFDAAVKSGNPEQVRKAGLDLQSDPIAVQKLNQAERPDLVEAHNQVTGEIKTGAKENIKENMAKEWNRTHPNDPPITKKDVEIYEPTNYKDPSAKPKSGQDWDVTVRVKGKDVPPVQSQKVVEKSYYDAAGGEKTFGTRAPGVTEEQAAAAAAHRQAVETTYGKSPEAYSDAETILGTKGEKPNAGKKLSDPEQLTHAIENKSNISSNKAAQAADAGDAVETVRQETEQMRQASKQYDKITKPRVEAAGGTVHTKVDDGMNVLRDAGAGKISPEQARVKLAEVGETPESIISKASGQAEAAQKLKTSGALPETTGAKALEAAGTAMIAVDIGSTAQDVKEDLKKGDIQGAAIKVGEAGANAITVGEYGMIKANLEKNSDKAEAYKQIADANKQNEAAYDLQAEKKLREAGVSREEAAKIMEAKAKGDGSALESKFKELGVKAPEKIVEKAPEGDDTAKERAVAVGEGMVDSAKKAGTFVKETVQDVGEITTGMAEKGVAREVVNQTKENMSDAYGTYQENKNAEKTTADFKQGVVDRLTAKGATPEGAEKAADALVAGDASKMKKLNDLLDMKKGLPPKDAKPESSDPDSKTSGTGTPDAGWGAAVAAGWQNLQNATAKGGDALKEMYVKYQAEQEKAAKEKAEKEKTAKEKAAAAKIAADKAAAEKAAGEKEAKEAAAAKQDAADKAAADKAAAENVASVPALPPGAHEEVSGWADDKNGKTRITYIKDANGNVLGGYNTHFDASGKEIGREDFKGDSVPPVEAPQEVVPPVETPPEAAPPVAPEAGALPQNPEEAIKVIDDSIAKIEAALQPFDAQITALDGQIAALGAADDTADVRAALNSQKATLMAYRPMVTDQLDKLKVLRQEQVAKLKKG